MLFFHLKLSLLREYCPNFFSLVCASVCVHVYVRMYVCPRLEERERLPCRVLPKNILGSGVEGVFQREVPLQAI